MKVLVVDAGNTSVKLALFEGKRIAFFYDGGILVSVVPEINKYILRIFSGLVLLKPWEINIPSKYSLKAVGADRIASVYPFIKRKESVIMVLFGTAITVNVVKNGTFYGGPIFPPEIGLEHSYNILSMKNANLHPDTLTAVSTAKNSMIYSGVVYEVERLKREFSIKKVVVSDNYRFIRKGWEIKVFPVIYGAFEIYKDRILRM